MPSAAALKCEFVPVTDRRVFARHNVCIPAKIGFNDKAPVNCTVRNISAMGALLEFDREIVLPPGFRIIIASKTFWADCEVRHQSRFTAGVMFVSNRAEALAAFG